MDYIAQTISVLDKAEHYFERIPGGTRLLPEIDRLRRRVKQPCVLAVGGKVKAGKSSFINALLGKRLAMVGEMETTATINMFRHISYADSGYTPERPVKVVWENGMSTYETTSFMDSLQGNDKDTLARAQGIDHLEFYVDDELLEKVTLVDTPGTDATVYEHQAVAETFFGLRHKHNKQTEDSLSVADAIVFLTGAEPRYNAQSFLKDFQTVVSGASALSALGVLSKIDISTELMERASEHAEYLANCMKEELYSVIPITAGLHHTIRENQDRLPQMMKMAKAMPQDAFDYFMGSEKSYKRTIEGMLQEQGEHIPSVEERESIKGDIPWALFRAILMTLRGAESVDEAFEVLDKKANIQGVKDAIYNHFFRRSEMIKCNRALEELLKMANELRRTSFPRLRRNAKDLKIWKSIINRGASISDGGAERDLITFIEEHLPQQGDIDSLDKDFVNDLIVSAENLQLEFRNADENYRNLLELQARRDIWSEEEYEELCSLFGLHGKSEVLQGLQPQERQIYWHSLSQRLMNKRDVAIALFAAKYYGNHK